MPRPYTGPKLWLDPKRGSWTILDGRKRIRTGLVDRDEAEAALQQYATGTYAPVRPVGPKPNSNPPRGGVYVVGFGQYIKIGFTANLSERLASLQTPEKLSLHAFLEGTSQLYEKILHARFDAHRANGEWFKCEGELADWLYRGCPADARAA